MKEINTYHNLTLSKYTLNISVVIEITTLRALPIKIKFYICNVNKGLSREEVDLKDKTKIIRVNLINKDHREKYQLGL